MSKIPLSLVLILTLLVTSHTKAQTGLEKALIDDGFENVRHITLNIRDVLFVEPTQYKLRESSKYAIKKIVEKNIGDLDNREIRVVILENSIPVETYSLQAGKERSDLKISSYGSLMRNNLYKSNRWKANLSFYPQFRFKNTRLDRIYLLQLNLNPTFELNMWRGAKLTAQIIIPIHNDYSMEESMIRPGFVTFSQHLRLPGEFHLLATIGNFNLFRMGADIKLFKSVTPKLGIYGQIGKTFWSLPLFDKWIYDDFDSANWRFGVNYYLSGKKILANINLSKYLDSDIAIRGELIRYFSKSSVGFYVQSLTYEGYLANGGFFFSIKLPPYKHKRKRWLRVTSGDNYSMEYIARPYPQRGRFHFNAPDESSAFSFFNKLLIGY